MLFILVNFKSIRIKTFESTIFETTDMCIPFVSPRMNTKRIRTRERVITTWPLTYVWPVV